MKELWLNYEDKDGEAKRVLVNQDSFVIGRHSGNDLSVASGKLSREHAKIDKFGDVYVISDLNSSNGTFLNGSELEEPVALENGDSIDFGGGLQVSVELISDEPESEEEEDSKETSAAAPATSSVSASMGSGGGSIPTSFFYVAPLLALVILLCAGGGLFIAYSNGSDGEETGKKGDYEYSTPYDEETPERIIEKDDTPAPEDTKPPENSSEETGNDLPETPSTTETSSETSSPPPKLSNENDKVRAYSASFLRRIVSDDPSAFLLDKQIQILAPKVNQLKSSSGLANNLKQVKQNSSQIQSIANEAGLKPQFLAAAALAKLGNNSGDVVATARNMAGIFQKLRVEIGVESADEATLLVAAYYQGEVGKFTQMKTTTEVLTGKNIGGASARQIRTIWFLKDNGKLNPEEFDLALRFLAIGTIMQNPSEFNVKAEPVILN